MSVLLTLFKADYKSLVALVGHPGKAMSYVILLLLFVCYFGKSRIPPVDKWLNFAFVSAGLFYHIILQKFQHVLESGLWIILWPPAPLTNSD